MHGVTIMGSLLCYCSIFSIRKCYRLMMFYK
jgi:hypothetical protein